MELSITPIAANVVHVKTSYGYIFRVAEGINGELQITVTDMLGRPPNKRLVITDSDSNLLGKGTRVRLLPE